MPAFLDQKDRKIIPRWRDFKTTASLGELQSTKQAVSPTSKPEDFLETKIRDWQKQRTASFASDLLGAAFVLGRQNEVRDAAEFILTKDSGATRAARSLATKVLGRTPPDDTSQLVTLNPRQRIHFLRTRLGDEPRNSLAWVDMAREYAILAMPDKAAFAMDIGTKLAPENRFILRSAARLHIHLDDPERAHHLLLKAESTPTDPWLVAAEIAISQLVKQPSKFIKRGRGMLSAGSYSPFHLTELASALATSEMDAGNVRNAKKLFRQALEKPTENSVAQVEWALTHSLGIELSPQHLLMPYSFEARALDAFYTGSWRQSLQESWAWLKDQPFSSRPAIHGSYVASVALSDFEEGEQLTRLGLTANPHDFLLLNNLVFSLASMGKLEEAEETFAKINRAALSPSNEVVWLATRGLLYYRGGQLQEGRALYQQAIEKARGEPFRRLRMMATIFWALQELHSNSFEAKEVKAFALDQSKGASDLDIQLLLQRLSSEETSP